MKNINFKDWKCLWLSLLFMLLDIGCKYWVKIHFFTGEVLFVTSCFNVCCVYNTGLAFGLFSNASRCFYYLFIWVAVLIVLLFLFLLFDAVKYFTRYYYFAYSMIIGGAVGNLLDRIFYGMVIDFIDIHVGDWHWPVFNVADLEICIGVVMLVIKRVCIFF